MSQHPPSRLTFTLVVVSVFAAAMWVSAAGPGAPARVIPYRGQLDLGGVPHNGPVDLTFHLYDDQNPDDSSISFSETVSVVTNGGRFSAILGKTVSIPNEAFDAAALFLSIDVEGIPLSGVQQIHAAPMAVRAGRAYDLIVENTLVVENDAALNGDTTMDSATVNGALVVEGSLGPSCPSDMTRIGAWCIDNTYTDDLASVTSSSGATFNTLTYQGAMRFCDSEGKDVCPLSVIMACDTIEPAGADCTQATDGQAPALAEVWTSTSFLDSSPLDAYSKIAAYNENTVTARADNDDGNEFWCCMAARH